MNVVLSALIIILLLYPGIFFRAVYFRGTRLDGTHKIRINILRQPIWEQVISSIIPALLIHVALTQLIDRFTHLSVDYEFIYNCLLGRSINQVDSGGKPVEQQVNIGHYLSWFAFYLLVALTIALGSAAIARNCVFKYRLDSKLPLLRFSNE